MLLNRLRIVLAGCGPSSWIDMTAGLEGERAGARREGRRRGTWSPDTGHTCSIITVISSNTGAGVCTETTSSVVPGQPRWWWPRCRQSPAPGCCTSWPPTTSGDNMPTVHSVSALFPTVQPGVRGRGGVLPGQRSGGGAGQVSCDWSAGHNTHL